MKGMEKSVTNHNSSTVEWKEGQLKMQANFDEGQFVNLSIGKEHGQGFQHSITLSAEEEGMIRFMQAALTDLIPLLKK